MNLSSLKNVHTDKRDNTYFEAYRGVTAFVQRSFGHRQILKGGLAEDVITFILMSRKPQGKAFAQIVQCKTGREAKQIFTKQCLAKKYKNNFFHNSPPSHNYGENHHNYQVISNKIDPSPPDDPPPPQLDGHRGCGRNFLVVGGVA